MAISEKPKKKTDTETRAQEFIRRGLGTAEESEHEKPVTFRLTGATIKRIDNARKARRVKTSKQSWFVEAILDKLEKEGF